MDHAKETRRVGHRRRGYLLDAATLRALPPCTTNSAETAKPKIIGLAHDKPANTVEVQADDNDTVNIPPSIHSNYPFELSIVRANEFLGILNFSKHDPAKITVGRLWELLHPDHLAIQASEQTFIQLSVAAIGKDSVERWKSALRLKCARHDRVYTERGVIAMRLTFAVSEQTDWDSFVWVLEKHYEVAFGVTVICPAIKGAGRR